MYCAKCGNQMDDDQQFCDKCGAKAGGQVNSTVQIRDKSAGIAVVLSFFFTGLGQIYVGKIVRGLCFILLSYSISGVAIFAMFAMMDSFETMGPFWVVLILFVVVSLVIWIWNMFDAYKLANEFNDYLLKNGKRPW